MPTETTDQASRIMASEAWGIFNRYIASLIIYGGLGWFVGYLLSAPSVGLAIGTIISLILATYMTVVRVSSLNESSISAGQSEAATSWSRRMTQIRIRNARENTQ